MYWLIFVITYISDKQLMVSIPRCPIRYHFLVCIKNYFFNMVIVPIRDKGPICIFPPVSLFVSWIEYRCKYYKINFRYTYVFKFFSYVILLWFLMCFGADTKIMDALLLQVCFVTQNTQLWLHQSQFICVYYILSTKQWSDNRGSADRSELDLKSDVNRPDSGKLW